MPRVGESGVGIGDRPTPGAERLIALAGACRRNEEGVVDVQSTLGRLARIVAEAIGCRCAIHVVDGGQLQLAAVSSADGRSGDEAIDPGLARAVVASGEPRTGPEDALGRRAVVVPIAARGRVLGTIGVLPGGPLAFDDRPFLAGIAARAACALEASAGWHQQDAARSKAEVIAARSQGLQEVTAALSEAVTSEQVAAVMAQRAIPSLGGSCGAVALASEETGDLRVVAVVDRTGVARSDTLVPLSSASPLAEAARTRAPVFGASCRELAECGTSPLGRESLPPGRETSQAERESPEDGRGKWDCESFVAFPVVTSRSLLGVLCVGYADRRGSRPGGEDSGPSGQDSGPSGQDSEADGGDLDFLRVVATLCGQALDRARLYEASQRERRRAGLLAETTRILSSSLDYRSTVEAAARCALTWFADIAAIDLFRPGALEPEHTVIEGVDPELERLAREAREHEVMGPVHPIHTVLRTGKSLAIDATSSLIESHTADPAQRDRIRALAPRSALIVPLTAHGTIGVVTFVSQKRLYGPDDLALAEELGRRAGVAIDNARLHARVREEGERLRVAHQEAREANRIKDEFLATVSHELRTPLNAILGWATLLKSRGGPDAVARGLDVIERNARVQARIIEDVLEVSRIITGKLRLELLPVDLEAVVAAAIEVVAPTADAKGVDFEARVAADGCRVLGDADRLQQVVWNLLSNAVKFTPRGGRVVLGIEREGQNVRIDVADTGRGIDPEFLPHVFERFRQADASPTRAQTGLGLGLAIVRHLVELHGGDVSARSPGLGQGTTFSVRLPLLEAEAPLPTAVKRVQPAQMPRPSRAVPSLSDLHVLVCDDQPDARTFLTEALSGFGAEVTAVSSASEALGVLAGLRPDLLVSDIGMPNTDGYELMRRIRSMPPCDGGMIPAIALTAYARHEDARRAFAVGYQRHVPKPVDVQELVATVAEVVGRL